MVNREVKKFPKSQVPQDPLQHFRFREATGPQVRQVLEQQVNPFTKTKWSGRYRGRNLLGARKQLPVFGYMTAFYQAFKSNQVIIVHGDTGTGKTTQIPQLVAYADLPQKTGKIIACAQTRRIAATAAAKRVAEEMDVTLGKHVGYTVRFDSKRDPTSTFLLFMTDGMLIHEAMHDRDLSKYSTIILDEVHERTLATDITMGFLKGVLKRRPDLKLVIMSATMDAIQLRNYFSESRPFMLEVPGRAYNVEVEYCLEPVVGYVDTTIKKILEIHRDEPEGDILVFLTGEEEIEKARVKLKREANVLMDTRPDVYGPLLCLSLYSNLPQHLQQLVWEKPVYDTPPRPGGPPGRKVILATNIAETSLTIDGIVYVVDPGFFKPRIYDPESESGFEEHTVREISKASAAQRKGRAGRTKDGKCFRLYTREEYEAMPERSPPEVQTVSLGELVLMLSTIGYQDPTKFPYIDKPDERTLKRAHDLLGHLGAVDKANKPTALGKQMVQFPLDVQLSKMLITSPDFGCSNEIVTIAAMLSAPHLWVRPYEQKETADAVKQQLFADKESDHLTLANAYNAFEKETCDMNERMKEQWCRDRFLSFRALREAESIRSQLASIMRRLGIPLVSTYAPYQGHVEEDFGFEGDRSRLRENVRKALVAGYLLQVAHSEVLGDLAHQKGKGSARKKRGTLNWEGGGKKGAKNKKGRSSFTTIRDEAPALLHPSSVLPLTEESEWVIFHSFVLTSEPFIRTVTNIKEEWLLDYTAKYYNSDTNQHHETQHALGAIEGEVERRKKRAELQKEQGKKGKNKRAQKKAAKQEQQPAQEQVDKAKKVRSKRGGKAKGAVSQALAEGQ